MKKYKVGYTTGVYDMFHIGYLNILKRTKEQCDYLIVGVSTDEVVRDYKGKTPIIPFQERIEIVESIKYVDTLFLRLQWIRWKLGKNYILMCCFMGLTGRAARCIID